MEKAWHRGTLYCLFAAALLLPWARFRFSIHGIPISGYEGAVALAGLCAAVEWVRGEWQNRKHSDAIIWVAILVLICSVAVAVPLSPDRQRALGVLKSWFIVPTLYAWLLTRFIRKDEYSAVIRMLWWDSVALSLWAIGQAGGWLGTVGWQVTDNTFAEYLHETPRRAFAAFDSPNLLAMWLVPVLFLKLWAGRHQSLKWYDYAAIALVVAAIGATHSQAGYLALIIGALVIATVGFVRTVPMKVGASLLILLFLIAGSFFAMRSDTGGSAVRKDIYRYSIELIRQHPVRGIGPGAFQTKVGQLAADSPSFLAYGLPYALHPHNIFLAFWLFTGLPGLLAFLVILWQLTVKLLRDTASSAKETAPLAATLVAILVHGLFDTTYFALPLAGLFWILTALIITENGKKHR